MERISIDKLNREGNLIAVIKKNAFVREDARMPYVYKQGGASTCYLHYFNDKYYVTQHVISTIQIPYYSFKDAQQAFNNFLECIAD